MFLFKVLLLRRQCHCYEVQRQDVELRVAWLAQQHSTHTTTVRIHVRRVLMQKFDSERLTLLVVHYIAC